MNISVIIPSYKNPKCLDICLHSAIDNQLQSNEIIVVLDGFSEMYFDIKNKYKDKVLFIEFEGNRGMQHALNIGVFHSTNSHILIVNDDNVFPMEWDKILLTDVSDETIITPNQIERMPSIFGFVTADFGSVDNFNYVKYKSDEPKYRVNHLTNDGEIFPFFMLKRDYMSVGGFDLIYDSPFICDWDFFLKLELIGKKFVRSRKLNFYHFGSISTKNGDERSRFNDSEKIAAGVFYYKWGFQPIRNSDNSHRPIDSIIKGVKY